MKKFTITTSDGGSQEWDEKRVKDYIAQNGKLEGRTVGLKLPSNMPNIGELFRQVAEQVDQSCSLDFLRAFKAVLLQHKTDEFNSALNKINTFLGLAVSYGGVTVDSADRFGNKAASLPKLKTVLATMPLVEVPGFFGIQHNDILAHLKNYYPEYELHWAIFVKMQEGKDSLSVEACNHLAKMRKRIEEAFAKSSMIINGVDSFIEPLLAEGAVLMVRSTGKEDSEKLANAGGNYSEAGVFPSVEAISSAIGRVVSSYHSPLSLTQRLLAKEQVTEEPFMPVLLQEMVGEPAAGAAEGEIPVSGIAYTREVLGKTENITQIQALYGHNEAAVNCQLPVDTFFAYADGTHHAILRPKTKRLVADGEGGFNLKANPERLTTASSLTPPQVQQLQKVSALIHNHYGKPMDIEWVLDRKTQILNIVQARPVIDRLQQTPSIVDRNTLSPVMSLQGESIVSNGGGITALTDPDEVIVDSTLERAFNRYWELARDGKADNIAAVVVKRPAAATSHYACTLREMGVAVFCCSNFDPKLLRPKGRVALIDSQQQMLFVIDHPAKSRHTLMAALHQEGCIKEGWFRHPIPPVESLQEADFSHNQALAELMCHDLLEGHTYAPLQAATDLHLLLGRLRNADASVADAAVKDLIHWIAGRVWALSKGDRAASVRGCGILRNAVQIGHRLIGNPPLMERLHTAQRLEALLMQPGSAEVLGADSLFQLLAERKLLAVVKLPATANFSDEEKKSLTRLEDKHAATPLDDAEVRVVLASSRMCAACVLSSELKLQWLHFTQSIAASRSRYANRMLMNLIRYYQNSRIFETWINLHFAEAAQVYKDNTIDFLQKLLLDFAAAQPIMKQVAEARERISSWVGLESRWADPANFAKLYDSFRGTVVRDIKTLTEVYQKTASEDQLARSALMQYLQESIDLYDTSIKAMRSSPVYTDPHQQAIRFRLMLEDYRDIMEMWVAKIPDEALAAWTINLRSTGGGVTGDFRQNAIGVIKERFGNIWTFDRSQLLPSVGANVNAAAIDSGNVESQVLMNTRTLEDLFTLLHQNIIAGLRSQYTPPWKGRLPPALEAVHEKMLGPALRVQMDTAWGPLDIKPNLLSMDYRYPDFEIKYNCPIKAHSAVFTIFHHPVSNETRLEVRLLGHNMGGRMDRIVENFGFLSVNNGLTLEEVPLYHSPSGTLSVCWRLSDIESVETALQMTRQAILDTLAGMFGTIWLNLGKMDDENLIKWDRLSTAKSAGESWMNCGLPYIGEIIARCNDKYPNTGRDLQILANIGIPLGGADLSPRLRVARGLIQLIKEDPLAFRKEADWTYGFLLRPASPLSVPAELYLLGLQALSQDSEVAKFMLSEKETFIYKTWMPGPVRMFMLANQMNMFEWLLQEGKVKDSMDFLELMAARGQLESIPFLLGYKWEAKDQVDFSPLWLRGDELVRNQRFLGAPVDGAGDQPPGTPVDRKYLPVVGERFLLWDDFLQKWLHVSVANINDTGRITVNMGCGIQRQISLEKVVICRPTA